MLNYLTSGPQSSSTEPQALQTMLQPLTGLDTTQSKHLQELLAKYDEAYSSDPRVQGGNADKLINDMNRTVELGGTGIKPSSLAAEILATVNAMNSGVSLGYGNGRFNLTPIEDAFFSGGKVYRPHDRDSALFFQDGGPMDPRGGGGRGNVVININGGDQALVYRTVARAMRAARG